MFAHQDCLQLIDLLERTYIARDQEWQTLLSFLKDHAENPAFKLETLSELGSQAYSFNEGSIEPFVVYLTKKSIFCEQFCSFEAFRSFLEHSSIDRSLVNLFFFKKVLLPKTAVLVQKKEDVDAYIRLLQCYLSPDDCLEYFGWMTENHIHDVFNPFKIKDDDAQEQSNADEVLNAYLALRRRVPCIYSAKNQRFLAFIVDFLHYCSQSIESSRQHRTPIFQGLEMLANYDWHCRKNMQRYNRFLPYPQRMFSQKKAVLVDVDQTLISRRPNSNDFVLNQSLISELKAIGSSIFLFTDMPCQLANVWERLRIKHILEKEHGLVVNKILTPCDLIIDLPQACLERLSSFSNWDDAFLSDYLVQVMIRRFSTVDFSPLLGAAFDTALRRYYDEVEKYCAGKPLPKDRIVSLETLRDILSKAENRKYDAFNVHLWKMIRYLEQARPNDAHIQVSSHIKWPMLQQFIRYMREVNEISIYEDQETIIDYLQCAVQFFPCKPKVVTHHVMFPTALLKTNVDVVDESASTREPNFFQKASAAKKRTPPILPPIKMTTNPLLERPPSGPG